ncbi:MAG: DUF4115 domain-containing protein [Bacteroidetes bacterium]|nr:DUF4115 domain-containing protein [Bacteroidota bacterium]MBU1117249.1 DUF4115 domain-containing protein [Bacteroidota bacterium]MBU1799618.1 DUF4115 domain-containing protein [Bacteroidota bacterium]
MTTLVKFAEELKKKRELLGITINDIHEKTRIDKKYLEEIEKGNFGIMPDVYMRAFIRKYADAIDCNVDGIIKRYEAACSGKNLDETVTNEEEKIPQNIISIDNHEPSNYDENVKQNEVTAKNYNPFIIVGFVVFVVIVGAFYFTILKPSNGEIIVEPKVEDILKQRSIEKDTSRFDLIGEPKIKPDEVSSDSLSLKINALDTVWFRIETDKTKKDEFILYPERSKTLTAKSQIDILIGNAGGIEFILNGKKLEFDGKKGEIRNVIVDAKGLHYSTTKTDSRDE